MGPFEPTDNYDCQIHANTVEGTYMGDVGASFSVVSDAHGKIDSAGVAIEDFYDGLGERILTVVGIPYLIYADIFREYDDYKAYYA